MARKQQCPRCLAEVPSGSRFCQACGSAVTLAAAKHPGGKRKSNGFQLTTFLAGALVLILAAGAGVFGVRWAQRNRAEASSNPAGAGATLMVDGAGPMPTWLASAGTAVVQEYTWAASHHNELQYIPCYCGCYDTSNHTSNAECYFKWDGNGKPTAYDQHAFG